jgi:tetratricopeptide (TPR) repeat protein
VFYELDQLYKKLNREPAERLKNLEAHAELVAQRDDLTVERISLLNRLGHPEAALELLTQRRFHPWEGGEGKVTGHYVISLVEIAKKLIKQAEHQRAVECLERAQAFPTNLGEGKLYGAQENHIFYYLGCAYAGLGENAQAQKYFERASVGQSEPSSPMYYNDQPPDMIFYQGLARQKLGRSSEAQEVFQKLIAYGQAHLNDDVTMDYFAVSLPDFLVFDEDLNRRNQIHCHYMMALGHLGLGAHADARAHFDQVLAWDINHLGAALHRQMADSE